MPNSALQAVVSYALPFCRFFTGLLGQRQIWSKIRSLQQF